MEGVRQLSWEVEDGGGGVGGGEEGWRRHVDAAWRWVWGEGCCHCGG